MRHEDLLHGFFDEGLDESLEDTLFSDMAADPELRRQFLEHMRLHSMIQEDAASITTPAHVREKLFVDLGLSTPQSVPATSSSWGKRSAAALLGLGVWLSQYRGYMATAIAAAGITALLFTYTGQRDSIETRPAPSLRDVVESAEPTPHDIRHSEAFEPNDRTDAQQLLTGRVGATAVTPAPSPVARAAVRSRASALASAVPGRTQKSHAGGTAFLYERDGHVGYSAGASSVVALPAALRREADARAMRTSAPEPIGISQTGIIEPWHFFRPVAGASLFSNIVFEIRKQYGKSYPDVDVQHSSHKVFENMALSAVYKATEHHAFGFEYGREDFGQEYSRMIPVRRFPTDDPNLLQVGAPSETATMAEFQERRMLDVFGAVWKLSLPEYGMFSMIYPYMRTFVGATKQGPLGKVRVGVEMYPSNFSMFNIGVEGGMLRYSVEQTSYYSAKLNYSFGVALAF
jgi:hypothetical protein